MQARWLPLKASDIGDFHTRQLMVMVDPMHLHGIAAIFDFDFHGSPTTIDDGCLSLLGYPQCLFVALVLFIAQDR